jgi:hypothetical protein
MLYNLVERRTHGPREHEAMLPVESQLATIEAEIEKATSKGPILFAQSKSFRPEYLATDYIVKINGRKVVIRPNNRSSAVEQILCRFKARTAAFITAHNPFSRIQSDITNSKAHSALLGTVRYHGWRFVEGYGQGHDQCWPPERSLLVFGLSRAAAEKLGRRFRQNAIVFVRLGRPAELVSLN